MPARWAAAVAAILLLVSLPTPAAATAEACGSEASPCAVEGGRYHAVPPPNWDGVAPLPAVIFFHGYQGSGARVIGNDALRRAVHDAGYMLVAPDELAGTWAHVGSPSDRRDEPAFMDRVRADLLDRWPVDTKRLLVAGFSQGGSMVWDLACQCGDAYTAFLAISGGFWEPLPEACPSGPVRLRHLHGWSDEVVPLEGRPIRQTFRQGDVVAGLALWRRHDGCGMPPDETFVQGRLRCRAWTECRRGGELQLCLHDGGHVFRAEWVAEAIAWMEGAPVR